MIICIYRSVSHVSADVLERWSENNTSVRTEIREGEYENRIPWQAGSDDVNADILLLMVVHWICKNNG